MQKLPGHWIKCVEKDGKYTQKWCYCSYSLYSYKGESESKGSFEITTLVPLMENKCTCYFRRSPLAQWYTSGIVQRASSSLRKRSFSVVHEATSAPFAGCHHVKWTATRANLSYRSSLIKASTLWMCWFVCDVNGWPGRLPSITLVLSCLKRSVHLQIFRWCMVRAAYHANIRRWISADLTPSAHRKCTMARCSSMVQLLSAARS
jgi:hypothetical protein